MLELARERARKEGDLPVEFRVGDVRSVRVGREFDAALLMFAVLGYQIADDNVDATLDTAALHTRTGGIVAFDVWWGPAVEAIGPSDRTKVIDVGDGQIERRARGRLEGGNVCTVDYDLVLRRDGQEVTRTSESHRMRYFDRPELESRMRAVGLELCVLAAFPDASREPSTDTWNAIAVGRKLEASGGR